MSRVTAPPVDLPVAPVPGGRASGGPEPSVAAAAALGLAALVVLLAVLWTTVGLGGASWAVGLGCGAVLSATLGRGLVRAGRVAAGPADLVTLSRGLLGCGVAALAVESLLGRPDTAAVLLLAVPALVLDAVDGWVARRTGTITAFGGRFDGEVDAFLILALSVYVAPAVGWWVLAAGLVRYVFAVAGWVLPWMRGRLEYRYWRKVVTAAVGIVLAVAAADVLPHGVTVAAVVGGLLLLAESFGRDVWWLWRHRPEPCVLEKHSERAWFGRETAVTLLALGLVWFALVAPSRPGELGPVAFLRLPVEALVVAGLALLVPARAARLLAVVVGTLLGVLTLLKVLDLVAFAVLDRPFDVVTDRSLLGSGVGFVRDSLGTWAATAATVAAVVLAGALVACLPWAVRRLTTGVARHRRGGIRAVIALAAVWVVCAISGLHVAPGEPVAAADTGRFVADKVRATTAALRDREHFAGAIAADPFRLPATGDLSGLRGKDVLVVFVESYGRVALDGPESGQVRALLDAATTRLGASGYAASSAFLTSPTFGGSSWLAHATLQSGLPVGHQGRYDQLLASDRTTLTSAFGRAGWRTVAVLPSNRGRWPEGEAFYGFDRVYDRTSLGYAGPKFGFSAIPDQYALSAFERLELAVRDRPPVMAEVDLTSSHGPWAPLPTTVDWTALGDGSVFHSVKADAVTATELWSDRADVPAAYRSSIVYSLTTLVSFVERYGDEDLVLVLLGDHQPSTIVSGSGANRDVPVTVVAHDPAVLDAIGGWGWREGLRPDALAPVWPMDAFRDRFLAAYSRQAPAVVAQGRP